MYNTVVVVVTGGLAIVCVFSGVVFHTRHVDDGPVTRCQKYPCATPETTVGVCDRFHRQISRYLSNDNIVHIHTVVLIIII